MKKRDLIILLMLLTFSFGTLAQQSMTFDQAVKKGIYKKLDSIYPGGIDSNPEKSLFKGQDAYIKSYQQFIYELSDFLKKNNFKWGKQVNCFNKIYFSKKGTVDYFLYNFKEGEITETQAKQFDKLLKKFVKNAKFSLPTETPFAQCSPVKYNDL